MQRNLSHLARTALLLAIVGLAAGFQAARSPAALAHGNVIRAEPGPNAVLESSPERVTIWFTEQLETQFGHIQLLDDQGRRVDQGDSAVDSQDPTVMSVSLPALPDGTYTVLWSNVSSVDGHRVRGSFLFSIGEPVGAAAPVPTTQQPRLQSPYEPVWRWLTLLSILAVVGGLAFQLLILRPVLRLKGADRPLKDSLARRSLRLIWLALGLFLVASIGHLLLQTMITTELSLSQVLGRPLNIVLVGTSWGRLWLWRSGLLLVLAAVLALPRLIMRRYQNLAGERADYYARLSLGCGLVPGAGILLTLSLASHAAATADIRTAAVINDYVHLLAASLWVGGLFSLALSLPLIKRSLSGRPRRAFLAALVPRFSVLAGLSLAVLVVTGLYSSWAQVTILPAMTTFYGQTLRVKLGLIIPLLLLGALNLLWLRPRLASDGLAGRRLGIFVSGEALLALLVLLPVGLLTALEPARQVASRAGIGREQVLSFAETVGETTVRLAIEPGRVGPNRFLVSLADRQGEPLTNVSQVSLRPAFLGADLGERPASATAAGEGQYVIEDAPLTIAGPWQVGLVVRRPDAFDARTAFRFEVTAGSEASSAAIAPDPDTGRFLAGLELGLLGLLLTAASLPAGGWRTRRGALVAWPGVAASLIGIFMAAGAGLPQSGRPAAIAAGSRLPAETDPAVVPERNPYLADAASLATGQEVYLATCYACHGATGRGDGPQARGQLPPPVDLQEHISEHPDAELFRIAYEGLAGTETHTFGDEFSAEQIWHLVNYLRIFAEEQHLAEKNYYRGAAFAAEGDEMQTLASFNEAIELSPYYARAYNGRGTLHRRAGDLAQALADHSRAIELQPDLGEAYFNRGIDYKLSGQLEQAIEDYSRAIELAPGQPDPYHARGLAYAETGDLAQAILDFDRALDRDPDYGVVYLDRGLAQHQSGRPARALADLEQYLALAPDSSNLAEVADLAAKLEAQLAGPAGGAMLALADFPAGFEVLPPASLGLVDGRVAAEGLTVERSFAFGQPEPFELVWGFVSPGLTTAPAKTDTVTRLEELVGSFLTGLEAGGQAEQTNLPIPAGLGEMPAGLSTTFTLAGLPTRLDALHFQSETAGGYIFVMYAADEMPVVPIGDLAGLLNERLGAAEE